MGLIWDIKTIIRIRPTIPDTGIVGRIRLFETDFVEADLTGADFQDSDLKGPIFENTVLEKADFRHAKNFIIDPENNRVKKTKFSMDGLPGLLQKYGIEVE